MSPRCTVYLNKHQRSNHSHIRLLRCNVTFRPFQRSRCPECSKHRADSRQPAGPAQSTTADLRTHRQLLKCSVSLCTRSSRQCCSEHIPPLDLQRTDKEIAKAKPRIMQLRTQCQQPLKDILAHAVQMYTIYLIYEGTCLVGIERTLAPRQRILKGVEKIPHDPGHDGVVVHAHQK